MQKYLQPVGSQIDEIASYLDTVQAASEVIFQTCDTHAEYWNGSEGRQRLEACYNSPATFGWKSIMRSRIKQIRELRHELSVSSDHTELDSALKALDSHSAVYEATISAAFELLAYQLKGLCGNNELGTDASLLVELEDVHRRLGLLLPFLPVVAPGSSVGNRSADVRQGLLAVRAYCERDLSHTVTQLV